MVKTLGILGGGQLGMMSAAAAQRLGIKTVIYSPEDENPAAPYAKETIIGAYDDRDALLEFAEKCDVISYEFENIPVATVQFLKTIKPVYPDESLLNITQDRLKEKAFLNETGIATARWAAAQSAEDIRKTLNGWGAENCILKTTRFGYDGKGQARISTLADIDTAWNSLNTDICIVEDIIDFQCEISVIVARDMDGHAVTYPPALNEHGGGILRISTVPSGLAPDILETAETLGKKLAEAVNLRGVLALELFVTKDGKLLGNEIAPRTHNSGHWSIEACAVSQFENHVRAVCGLPVMPPDLRHHCRMVNLIGDDILNLEPYKNRENTFIYDYGKGTPRPNRKMGHVTTLQN